MKGIVAVSGARASTDTRPSLRPAVPALCVALRNVRTTATSRVHTRATVMPRVKRRARSSVPAGQIFLIFFLVIGDRGRQGRACTAHV